MEFAQEQREALHLLESLENGTMTSVEATRQVLDADPALVHLIFSWLRSRYGGDHPAAEGVVGRLVQLSDGHPSVAAQMREGKADPIVKWFEKEHAYRDFSSTEFIALVIEKLEG